MSATSGSEPTKTLYRTLMESGKTAVVVPVIIGASVIVGIIMLWDAHIRKTRIAEMARIEEMARIDLRAAYHHLRALEPEGALEDAALAREKMGKLRQRYLSDYSDLMVALLLIEGDALFMADSKANAAAAEERFNQALATMTYASGEMWLLGMAGRARTRYEIGRYREAEADLSRILERNSSFGTAYYWRSQTRDKLGDSAGAAEDARHARNLDSWPPYRDFLQHPGEWTRDILCLPGECPDSAEVDAKNH